METKKTSQDVANHMCLDAMRDTLQKLRDAKPEERNELARRYAISITEMEKVLAYFWSFIMTDGAE